MFTLSYRKHSLVLWAVGLGVVAAAICSLVYLINPPFIALLNNKVMDAIVAGHTGSDSGQTVTVIAIDEKTLATYGQWPWPRYQLARLLSAIADRGAVAIGLDFVMAEPDRISLKALRQAFQEEYGHSIDAHALPDPARENDAALAGVLSEGPFVLGYEFLFDGPGNVGGDCRLHAMKIIRVQKSPGDFRHHSFHQADKVVCNLALFADAVSHSGFLNGRPDADGVFRRLPLLIRFGEESYPGLALATLLQARHSSETTFLSAGNGMAKLIIGRKAIPMDPHGCLRIDFGSRRLVHHVSALDILNGTVSEKAFQDGVVFVGLSASGLNAALQVPSGELLSEVEIQAQAAKTILSENYIHRSGYAIYYEVFFSLLLALIVSFGIVRLRSVPMVSLLGLAILVSWLGAKFLFAAERVLFSPFLPIAVVFMGGIAVSFFKFWNRQHVARQSVNDAVVLMKGSERKLDSIIQTIPDIVFRLDPKGRITFISPAISKYAKQPEEMIGKYILDIVAPEDRGIATYKINERRTGSRATSDMEMRLLLAPRNEGGSASERYFSVSAEGIYTREKPDKDSFQGTQGIARDISRRKQLEYQLEQSKKMEAIGGLAAGVAHDLNNILSGLVSYPELLLLDLPGDSPMREKIETIQKSGQRAAAIVQDMLTIARRGVSHLEVVNLNHVIADYLTSPEYQTILENHPGIDIGTILSDDLMSVMGARVQVLKVLMNLINNAAEAMPTGGSITLTTRNRYLDAARNAFEEIPEGEYVRLRVADSGVGIAATDLPRVFEPFYTKKRMGQSGSGLGMTVVWSTVKDHCGYMDVHSREGVGTRFDIYFPATRKSAAEKERPAVLQDYLGTERILVVDDIPEQRDIAVRMLGKLGYDVISLPSGEKAVEFMETRTVDLLVLDMVMLPGIDGLETYRRICLKHPAQKAIIASGYSESGRVKQLQALGAGAYIRKPYTLEKIGMAVRRELDRFAP